MVLYESVMLCFDGKFILDDVVDLMDIEMYEEFVESVLLKKCKKKSKCCKSLFGLNDEYICVVCIV